MGLPVLNIVDMVGQFLYSLLAIKYLIKTGCNATKLAENCNLVIHEEFEASDFFIFFFVFYLQSSIDILQCQQAKQLWMPGEERLNRILKLL
jgi:hypothetical protein